MGASKPWETTSRAAVDELWWEYAKRTPFYYEMRMQHILTMIRKEQKVNALIEDKLKRILQNMKSEEDMPAIEELLYQKLEKEFLIADELEKLL